MTENQSENKKVFLEIKDLIKYFDVKSGVFSTSYAKVHAVDGVSLTIYKGESFGLVGESGCGKTTLGQTILRLTEPTSGKVILDGVDVAKLKGKELKSFRKKMQIIFQDPYSSLNPRLPVSQAICEPLIAHKLENAHSVNARILELLEMVGLKPYHAGRYPHEFSGGQRQRIAIARALSVNPQFIVCDEPVSALDVSIQAQVLNLLNKLKRELNLTYLFISHDLSVVRHMCDRVAIMYLGKIVEIAKADELFDNPKHPYTVALLSAVPVPEVNSKRKRILLEGDLPSPINPPSGCRFHERCPRAMEICKTQEPLLASVGKEHICACHLHHQEPGEDKNEN